MTPYSLPLLVASLLLTSDPAASCPRISKILVEQQRAVIRGETDATHQVVLQIDDGTPQPREWRSGGCQKR